MAILKKTKGIILLRKNFRSTSKIIDFYSINYGRLILLAKGVREGKNYLAGALEPLNYCEVIFYRKENSPIFLIKEASLLYHFPLIIKEPQKYSKILNLNKFLSLILPIEEENKELFNLYFLTLLFANIFPYEKIKNIILSFYLKAIAISGFQPSLFECLKCNKKIFEADKIFFDLENGGIVCENCYQIKENTILINKKILKNLQYLLSSSYQKLLNSSFLPEIEKIISLYINYHLNKSLTF